MSSGIDANVGCWLARRGNVWLRTISRRLVPEPAPEGVAVVLLSRGLNRPSPGSSEKVVRKGKPISPEGTVDGVGVVLDDDEAVIGLGRVDARGAERLFDRDRLPLVRVGVVRVGVDEAGAYMDP